MHSGAVRFSGNKDDDGEGVTEAITVAVWLPTWWFHRHRTSLDGVCFFWEMPDSGLILVGSFGCGTKLSCN